MAGSPTGAHPARAATTTNGDHRLGHDEWLDHTRVFLQPIAPPSILGLFGFAGATFMVATNMAHWYGNPASGILIFPFALTFGGLAQFAAGMWAYRARDAIATAMHGMWGAFWIAYGILWFLVALRLIPLGPASGKVPALGYWFIALSAITVFGAIAALGTNLSLTSVLATLAVGAALTAVWRLVGGTGWEKAGGWVLFASACLALYTAGSMMIASAWGRTVLPLGEYRKAANIPGQRPVDALQYEFGEPGIKQGQ
jgi:succinate-acetate transporter protein